MTDRTNLMRRHNRFPVSWPALYRGDEVLAEGTVLDLTHTGWRIAGTMPVMPGMRLAIKLWVPDKPEPVRISAATVLWVKNCEFAIEVQEMGPTDRKWVTEFLNQKLGLSWMGQTVDGQCSVETLNGNSHGYTDHHRAHHPKGTDQESAPGRAIAAQSAAWRPYVVANYCPPKQSAGNC